MSLFCSRIIHQNFTAIYNCILKRSINLVTHGGLTEINRLFPH